MDFAQWRWLGIKSFIPGEVFHNPGAQGQHPEGAASRERLQEDLAGGESLPCQGVELSRWKRRARNLLV